MSWIELFIYYRNRIFTKQEQDYNKSLVKLVNEYPIIFTKDILEKLNSLQGHHNVFAM